MTGFVVTTRTETSFMGYRALNGRTITFRSDVISSTYVKAEINVAGTVISMYGDALAGNGGIVSLTFGNALWPGGEDDLVLLETLTRDFQSVIPWPEAAGDPDSANVAEGLLRAYVSFLATARHDISQGTYDFDLGDIKSTVDDTYYPDPTDGGTSSMAYNGALVAQPNFVPPGAPPYCSGGCNCVDDEDFTIFGGFIPSVQFLPQCCAAPFGRPRQWFSDTQARTKFSVPQCTGKTQTDLCGVGTTPGCRGRCGYQCYAPAIYTQDCFDHDLCSGTFTDVVWAGDRSCGDEFWEAASDTALIYGSMYVGFFIYSPATIPYAMIGCY